MIRMLTFAAIAALMTACAGPVPSVAGDPMFERRGSTEAGRSKASALGFHGPLERAAETDGPN